uniref:Transmembrane protein 254 n=1 Tax=Sphenodon punctatus TaxID=8508 RepID=A0A8D0HAB5_SPHPU
FIPFFLPTSYSCQTLCWFLFPPVPFSKLLLWVVISPERVPYDRLGQFGRFTKYLVDHHYKLLKNGFWLAWGLHVAEALYSVKLCKTKGITDSSTQQRWFIQTFLFGIASLSHLLAYRTQLKKQR